MSSIKVQIYGYEATMDLATPIRKNFTLSELANTSGTKSKPMFFLNSYADSFLDMLQEFRNGYANPMTISSGYRQTAFNQKVGGDPKSAHLHMCAVDWYIRGQTEANRRAVRDRWASICQAHGVIGAINYYSNGYHLEAFTDKWYGSKTFQVRDYRKTTQDW